MYAENMSALTFSSLSGKQKDNYKSEKYDHLGERSPEKEVGREEVIIRVKVNDFLSGCQKISQCHHKQSFSELHSPE